MKNNNKYFKTACLFDEALLELLTKKEIDYITVKEVCKKAGFNRSTFYLHYESLDDLLNETVEYVYQKFDDYYNESLDEFTNKIQNVELEELKFVEKKYLTPYLSFIKENHYIFTASLNNPYSMKVFTKYDHLKKYILNPILDRFNVPQIERKYLLNFYISGIIAIIKEWLNDNCKDDIAIIEDIIIKYVNS